MTRPCAIVDTSFLIYSSQIKTAHLLRGLSLIFEYLLIPQEVIREFTPTKNLPENQVRYKILSRLDPNQGFYRICPAIDYLVFDLLKTVPHVDPGEAEAIAQARKRQVMCIFTDDKKILKHLPEQFNDLRFYSTLTVVALLDLQQQLSDYHKCVEEVYMLRKFTSKEFRKAYLQAASHLGIGLTKKRISEKTSLTKLGLK